jgi:hypothetical protein
MQIDYKQRPGETFAEWEERLRSEYADHVRQAAADRAELYHAEHTPPSPAPTRPTPTPAQSTILRAERAEGGFNRTDERSAGFHLKDSSGAEQGKASVTTHADRISIGLDPSAAKLSFDQIVDALATAGALPSR